MILNETQIRIRYGETDRMGYAYYGNYLLYYEIGRTEMIRQLGLTYRQLEDNGTLLPVHSVQIKYIAPAFYDDLLTLRTTLREYPGVSIKFEHEILNPEGKLINTGEVKLVFVDSKTHRPIKAPKYFLDLIDPYFNKK
jgi:acyl-CoA thioester hydrolase